MARLGIQKVGHLAKVLSSTVTEISEIAANADKFYQHWILRDPKRPEKPREVVNATGALRELQSRLYQRILLPKLVPSEESHGGVRGRSIKSNASAHADSTHAFKADISSFYPSIHNARVYRLFNKSLGCSPDVSRVLTRLCTYRHHLALGLITSPILADQILKRIDRRIAGACKKANAVYTRFVDDITVSCNYPLDDHCGLPGLIEHVLYREGFRCNKQKHVFGRLDGSLAVTGVVPFRGKLNVLKEYLDSVLDQLSDSEHMARGTSPNGPYFTQEQIIGRVQFIAWVNPRRRPYLMRRVRSIDWQAVRVTAVRLGLVEQRVRLEPMQPPTNGSLKPCESAGT